MLDLASHDGRWSLAALMSGARSVTSIEARPELVKGAAKNLAQYGYGADRARFLTGDVHQVLSTRDFDADVVLCLGFLYHTLRYNELLHGIRRTGAGYLIIDTFSPYTMEPVPNVNTRLRAAPSRRHLLVKLPCTARSRCRLMAGLVPQGRPVLLLLEVLGPATPVAGVAGQM